MGGLATEEQSALSLKRLMERLGGGELAAADIVRILAEDSAYGKHEHAMRMSMAGIAYEVRDGKLYSPTYKIHFDELINPPADRRSKSYAKMPEHIKQNLLEAQRLIISGKVEQLAILSPSIDFAAEGSTKGQVYCMRRMGNQVVVLCTDHSQNVLQMQREAQLVYGLDPTRPLAGNTINGGGLFAVTRQDPPSRRELADVIRSLGNEQLARQYEEALNVEKENGAESYIEKLIKLEETEIYKKLAQNGIDLKIDPASALRAAFLYVTAELQAIKANLSNIITTAYPDNFEQKNSAPFQEQIKQDAVVLSAQESAPQNISALPQIKVEQTKADAGNTNSIDHSFEKIAFDTPSTALQAYRQELGIVSAETRPASEQPILQIKLAPIIDAARFEADALYRLIKEHEAKGLIVMPSTVEDRPLKRQAQMSVKQTVHSRPQATQKSLKRRLQVLNIKERRLSVKLRRALLREKILRALKIKKIGLLKQKGTALSVSRLRKNILRAQLKLTRLQNRRLRLLRYPSARRTVSRTRQMAHAKILLDKLRTVQARNRNYLRANPKLRELVILRRRLLNRRSSLRQIIKSLRTQRKNLDRVNNLRRKQLGQILATLRHSARRLRPDILQRIESLQLMLREGRAASTEDLELLLELYNTRLSETKLMLLNMRRRSRGRALLKAPHKRKRKAERHSLHPLEIKRPLVKSDQIKETDPASASFKRINLNPTTGGQISAASVKPSRTLDLIQSKEEDEPPLAS